MTDQKTPPEILKAQWAYVDELVALGYETLRTRDGEDKTYSITWQNGEQFLIRTIIMNDCEGENTVWVHTEARECEDSMPWHSGFTMSAAGEVEGH